MQAKKTLIWAGVFVILNNIAWYYASFDENTRTTELSISASTPFTGASAPVQPVENKPLPATPVKALAAPSAKNLPIPKQITALSAAPKTLELEANLPIRASEELIAEQAFSKETFTFDSQEQKIATIAAITPQGEDLVFLQSIIDSSESEAVKIAAIERLNGQQQFSALNAAVRALDSNNTNLGLAALGVIKSSRDISLIPQLRNRALNEKNAALKHEIDTTIGVLENSVSMGMDFASQDNYR